MVRIGFTYPYDVEDEVERIVQLLEGEFDFFHLKKPDYSSEQMVSFIESIPPKYHSRLVIHSHYELASEYGLKGIATNANTKSLAGQHVVSYSAHSFDEIKELKFKPEYVFLSPIWNSISKEGYKSPFNNKLLVGRDLGKSDHEIIALGGVNHEKVELTKILGFAGYAMLGAIWVRDSIKNG